MPWATAFSRSIVPSRLKSHTNPIANGQRRRSAAIARKARVAAIRSPYASGTLNDRGRLGSVTAGTITVSPRVRSVWMSSNGTNAAARGRTARRGHTYHFAARAYVTMVAAV